MSKTSVLLSLKNCNYYSILNMHIKNFHLFIGIVVFSLMLSACSKSDDPNVDPGPKPYEVPKAPEQGSIVDRTVLVYVVADNSLSNFATSDLQEISEAIRTMDANLYKNNNLLIFYDQKSESLKPKLFRYIKTGEVKTSEIDPNKKELVIGVQEENIMEYPGEVTSTEPSIIKEVMDKSFSTFPAKSYGFVYWSHGDGWLPGIYQNVAALRSLSPLKWMGIDSNNSSDRNALTYKTGITELAEVLKGAPKKLEFLLLDACFMISMETAYELKDCTNYLIGSPTETPGPGAPYTQVVPAMFASSQAAAKMGEIYFNFYENKFNPNVTNSNSNWTGGVSITVLDCTKLRGLATVTRANLSSQPLDIVTLRSKVFDYDKRNSSSHVGYFDMQSLMEQILTPTGYVEWLTAYQSALTFWKTTPKNYSSIVNLFSMEGAKGVSHYIPSANGSTVQRDEDYRSTTWFQDAGFESIGW